MDTSKSHRKRLRRNRNAKFKSSTLTRFRKSRDPEKTTTTKTVPDIELPKITTAVSDEEMLLNDIAANITANSSEITVFPSNEIYFADEIPQCITDDIVLSSTTNAVQENGPSVIVEYLPTMDTFDENELNGLINLNEQELIDRFLNCGDDHEIFVN